jgi:hypothetical protein
VPHIVEVVTPDGATIRICGQRNVAAGNEWDEELGTDQTQVR